MSSSFVPSNHLRGSRQGFTLVEMLVVIGVIGLVTAGLAFSLRGGGQAQALQAGQANVISLVTAARSQAALNQREAAILIWGDESDSERYLRYAAVGLSINGSNTDWEVKKEGFYLPSGVFFVPPDASAIGPAKLANPADWINVSGSTTSTYKTLADPASAQAIKIRRFNSSDGTYEIIETTKIYVTVRYTPIGQLAVGPDSNYENQIVVAGGEAESASVVRFDSPEFMRGVFLSTYGIPTIINEKLGFKL